jgi:hypothetical protein
MGLHGLVNLSRPRLEVHMNTRDRVLAQLQLPPLGAVVTLGMDLVLFEASLPAKPPPPSAR